MTWQGEVSPWDCPQEERFIFLPPPRSAPSDSEVDNGTLKSSEKRRGEGLRRRVATALEAPGTALTSAVMEKGQTGLSL